LNPPKRSGMLFGTSEFNYMGVAQASLDP